MTIVTWTFQQLQNRVQQRLIDLPPAVLSEIPNFITAAQSWLEAHHNFNCMRSEVTGITQPAPIAFNGVITQHQLCVIPDDWKEPRENPYYQLEIGSTREIDWSPAGSRVQTYRQWDPLDPNSKGPPRLLLISDPVTDDENTPDTDDVTPYIEFYPYSDSLSDWTTSPVGEYRIHIPYWAHMPLLQNATDHNWYTDNGPDFIISAATAWGFEMNWDMEKAQYWLVKAFGPKWDGINVNLMGGFARALMNLDKSVSYAPGRVLIPRRDVYAPIWQWRT